MKNLEKTKLSYLVKIPKIVDEALLCFAEGEKHIPFSIKRFYFIYDVDNNAVRGKHAHKKNLQVLFCIKGTIKILIDNGKEKEELILDDPNKGIFLNKLMWHEMHEFTKDTILLVIASEYYEEKDYIRDYSEFQHLVNKRKIFGILQNFVTSCYDLIKSPISIYSQRGK